MTKRPKWKRLEPGELRGGLGGVTVAEESPPPPAESEYPLRGEQEEAQLERRAIIRHWPLPEEKHRRMVIDRQTFIAASPSIDPDTAVKAFRALNEAFTDPARPKTTGPSLAAQINVGTSAALDRKRAAEVELAEINLSERRGELISRSETEAVWTIVLSRLQTALVHIRGISADAADILERALLECAQEIGD